MHGTCPVPSSDGRGRRVRIGRTLSLGAFGLCAALSAASALEAVTLDSITPRQQRVNDLITLRGSGFGLYEPGVSKIVFANADQSIRIEAGIPYVWRDDYIKVRVPVGQGNQKMPKSGVSVTVETANGDSAALSFQLLFRVNKAAFSFVQRTEIVNDEEVSGFLGSVDDNKARTKHAEFGDLDGDGFPELLDNNSNNTQNGTHSVLRMNLGLGRTGFDDIRWEPTQSGDNGGPFAVKILPGGKYVGNAIVYDADLVDLNNDELPDWVEAEAGSSLRLRIDVNNYQGVPGRFVEATDTWAPNQTAPGSPDDVRNLDFNYDGFIDVATSYRFSSSLDLFLNQNGQTFNPSVRITGTGGASMHDLFPIDANHDGYTDLVGVNENGNCQMFMNNGQLPVPGFTQGADIPDSAQSGIAADLNGDGFEDFAVSRFGTAAVYLNNPANPGQFTRFALPNPSDYMYDIEAADIDLDGDIDLVAAVIILNGDPDRAARVWLNRGDGKTYDDYPNVSDILPGIGPYQRLSFSAVDYDRDGDLDVYLTGSDGEGPWCFGCSPNQFWENQLTGMEAGITGSCPGPINFTIDSARANCTVAILGSKTLGAGTLAGGGCAGTPIDLVNPKVLAVTQVDGNGHLDLSRSIPAGSCGSWLQVVEAGHCTVSNVVPTP